VNCCAYHKHIQFKMLDLSKILFSPVMNNSKSLSEVHATIDPGLKNKGWKKIFAFFGPAYLVSVGYMDPGNWATDIAGGSQFGYKLIWVLLMSNITITQCPTGYSKRKRFSTMQQRDIPSGNKCNTICISRDSYCRLRPGRSDRYGYRSISVIRHTYTIRCTDNTVRYHTTSLPATAGNAETRGIYYYPYFNYRPMLFN
jgi:hypothetical protein